jgi:hypothetical protein
MKNTEINTESRITDVVSIHPTLLIAGLITGLISDYSR